MKNKFPLIWCVVLVLAGCSSGPSRPATPGEAVPKSSSSPGKILYEQKCTQCHGEDGTKGIAGASNLQQSQLDQPSAAALIANGKGSMPAFKGSLDSSGIYEVTMYLTTLKK